MDMTYDFSVGAKRLAKVPASPIRVILEKAAAMRSQGIPVISFSAGEPDFNTPTDIKKATIEALNQNLTHYTSNRGYPKLRKALHEYTLKYTGVDYDPETEILITSGGAEGLNNAVFAFVDEGDDVLVFTPSFVNYKSLTNMCGANFVEIPLDRNNDFRVDISVLKNAITLKTKMLILNNPNNPSGTVYNKEDLQMICELAVQHNFLILSDEMYSRLVYEGETFYSVASFPGMKERTIIVSGFSKTFAMTGWRLGYITAASKLADRILRVHQYSTTCSPTFSQAGVAEAMNSENTQREVEEMLNSFARRRELIIKGLSEIPGLSYAIPYGAFYILVDVSALGMTGTDFAEQLLSKKYVATVPGIGFSPACGAYIRISYATSESDIKEGLRRIAEFVNEI